MTITGTLFKMLSEYQNPVRYYLDFKENFVDVNQNIGNQITLEHVGNECKACHLDKPIFRMGFCKNCFFTVPQANPNILRPELSTAHLGEEKRDLEWEKKFELQPHIVYLALSGGLKVGVTREKQVPHRWIDQGASQAVILAKTENRYEAGMIEVAMKNHLADKTHWQRMLKNQDPTVDLIQTKKDMQAYLPKNQAHQFCEDDKIWEIHYPVAEYPTKVKSVSLEKTSEFSGRLKGIRGQYLIFENDLVLNIRSHEGFVVNFTIQS